MIVWINKVNPIERGCFKEISNIDISREIVIKINIISENSLIKNFNFGD